MRRILLFVSSALIALLALGSATSASHVRRWDSAYTPTAIEWLAISMQAYYTRMCDPVELSFQPAPKASALGILFPDGADSKVGWKCLDQVKQLALVNAHAMGYPAPEIFTGSVGEFIGKYGKTGAE